MGENLTFFSNLSQSTRQNLETDFDLTHLSSNRIRKLFPYSKTPYLTLAKALDFKDILVRVLLDPVHDVPLNIRMLTALEQHPTYLPKVEAGLSQLIGTMELMINTNHVQPKLGSDFLAVDFSKLALPAAKEIGLVILPFNWSADDFISLPEKIIRGEALGITPSGEKLFMAGLAKNGISSLLNLFTSQLFLAQNKGELSHMGEIILDYFTNSEIVEVIQNRFNLCQVYILHLLKVYGRSFSTYFGLRPQLINPNLASIHTHDFNAFGKFKATSIRLTPEGSLILAGANSSTQLAKLFLS